MRVLAVSDEVDRTIDRAGARRLRPDLVVGCGDVGFDVLRWLGEATGAPVVFVPGNHDPDVSGYRPTRSGLVVKAGFVTAAPWPPGTANADGRVIGAAGLRIAGLGGCLRYRPGPNQYTEAQQRRRARRLVRRVLWSWAPQWAGGLQWAGGAQGTGGPRWPRRSAIDVLLAHTAPRGLGDGDDVAHAGFEAFTSLARTLRPKLLLHGHVAPRAGTPDHWIGETRVVNVFGHKLLEVDPPDADEPGAAAAAEAG